MDREMNSEGNYKLYVFNEKVEAIIEIRMERTRECTKS